MKITNWHVHTPDQRFHVFLEIETDNGLTGWGAGYSYGGQLAGALEWLKRFVMNENPLEFERITEKLHQTTFWLGRGGAMTHAISAVNIALWDLAGKALGVPVSVLLGGRYHEAVPAYGSVLFVPVETLAGRIHTMRERGFRSIKLGWDPFGRQSLAEDEKLIRLARHAAGDETNLMIDAGGSYPFWPLRYKDALERAQMLANYGVYWFEEALAPDDIEGYQRLADASPVKISHGEVLTRRQSFLPYFQRRAMDIVQPDATKVGGLSEMRRIAWMAAEYGIDVVPHGWNTAVGVASDIHFVASLASRSFVEFNVGNPLVEQITGTPFRLDEHGCLPVPAVPGLGIEIDREHLRHLADTGFASETWTWDENKEFEA
ncbi:MAG TPA: mandelate racemase/muconate lactonizing enzyme family protein [Bryobacteraceae bacterium]|nr:mandelate racemase/muconate lactonizing enzyme family protein [Bryobacteraceae bacterium]